MFRLDRCGTPCLNIGDVGDGGDEKGDGWVVGLGTQRLAPRPSCHQSIE